jgi:hypothetical protein
MIQLQSITIDERTSTQDLERIRRNIVDVVRELQQQPVVPFARPIKGIRLEDGKATPIPHGLGRKPLVFLTAPRGATTTGRILELDRRRRGSFEVLHAAGLRLGRDDHRRRVGALMNGLNWQTWNMRFTAGLNQKADPRTLEAPELTIAKNIEFDRVGGIQTRKPFDAAQSSISTGTTIANARHIVPNGNERLLFTKDSLYSWNASLSKWVLKGTHLAVKVDERPVFVTTGEQIDADRAELNGTIIYTWTETVGASSLGYVAAVDKTTNSVLMSPTRIVGTASRMRVTALATKILLTFYDGVNGLYAYALDPAAPATALAGSSTTVTNVNYGTYYDIVKVPERGHRSVCRAAKPDGRLHGRHDHGRPHRHEEHEGAHLLGPDRAVGRPDGNVHPGRTSATARARTSRATSSTRRRSPTSTRRRTSRPA